MTELTELEAMVTRFSRENIHKSTGTIAKNLGIPRKEFEELVERGMKRESEILNRNEE